MLRYKLTNIYTGVLMCKLCLFPKNALMSLYHVGLSQKCNCTQAVVICFQLRYANNESVLTQSVFGASTILVLVLVRLWCLLYCWC